MRTRNLSQINLFDDEPVEKKPNLESNSWEKFTYTPKIDTSAFRAVISPEVQRDNSSSVRANTNSGSRQMESSVFQNGNTYTSFSGADTVVSILFKGGLPVILGECQTFTYSIFRPIVPVYLLGRASPAGFTKGPRTIAGSLIFTVFDRHALINALHQAFKGSAAECLDKDFLIDNLPPFDFHVTFLNEYGQSAQLIIYDVKLNSEGQVLSIEDMITEQTFQYVASNVKVMTPDIYENT